MRRFYCLILLIFLTFTSQAKTTNWIGLAFNDIHNWFNASNWDNGVPGAGDIAQIGVNAYYNYAEIGSSTVTSTSTTPSIGTLIFGVATTNQGLKIDAGYTLTVTGNTKLNYASSSAVITITGTGALNCQGAFLVGDNTSPTVSLITSHTYVATINVNIPNFTVGKDLILNTTATNTLGPINVNNPLVYVINGTLNVTGGIKTTNSNYLTGNSAQLIVNPSTTASASQSTLGFGRLITLATGGSVDFYGPGPGTSTTIYSGSYADSTQFIYSTSKANLDASPDVYQNLIISGVSPKRIQSGTVTISGDWTSSGGYIDAQTNANTITFQGTAQSLTDNGSHGGTGVMFNNVTFQGSGVKTLSTGSFAVGSTGVLTMAGTASLTTNSLLTLMSSAAGTTMVATIPTGTSINGLVKSQRFIKGSLDVSNLTKRGYRLLSSPVYTYTSGGNNYFDVKYLLDSAYVSGATGGGFNATTTNPSLYLYREDVSSNAGQFTGGNWKGIAKINNTNAYDIGTQKRLTTTNTADTTLNLPAGNGILFFFRGNKSDNSSQSGTKLTQPFDYPEDVIFTQTGYLNTGTIAVRQWYSGSTNFSITSASNVNNSGVRGFAFVGNPYASTINFEKFNRSGSSSSIYGKGFPAPIDTVNKIWVYNPKTKQYDTYMQAKTISSVADSTTTIRPSGCAYTGDASNMIASGQGFFMKVSTTNRGLTFRETAKTTTQPSSTNLNNLMSAPASDKLLAFSSASINASPAINPATLGLTMAKDNDNTDDAVIVFNDRTPGTYSESDDAEDMNGNGAVVSLSVISSDNVALAIKQRKLPLAGSQTTRLLVDATASGIYHLKLRNLDNLPDAYEVWLMDNFAKDSLDLKHNKNYDFKIDKNNAATFGRNRFSLIVRLNPAGMMHALSIAANKTIKGAEVSWHTENEGSNFTFSVEKSLDGKKFDQIGQVLSNGSGTYAYTDATPVKGINYYKLKFQDMALGTFSYSGIVSLNYIEPITPAIPASAGIAVYPNPATSTVNIKMSAGETSNDSYIISISNSTGRIIKQITSNSTILQTDVTQFLPGTYMVQVVNLSDKKPQGQSKFVKL